MDSTFDCEDWEKTLNESREMARDYFLNEFNWRGAPMPDDFDGPRYYPIDPNWRLQAKLDRSAPGTGQHVQLDTSVGDLRDFEVYGQLAFTVDGQECRLTAYRSVPEDPVYD